jgi:hypothetical protein
MENTFTGISGSNQAKLHLMLESIFPHRHAKRKHKELLKIKFCSNHASEILQSQKLFGLTSLWIFTLE